MKKLFKSASSLRPFSVLALTFAIVGGARTGTSAPAEPDGDLLATCRTDDYRISFYGRVDQGISAADFVEVERVIGRDVIMPLVNMECSANPNTRPAGSDFTDWLLLACSAVDRSTTNSSYSAGLRLDGDGTLHATLERFTSESALRVRSVRLADLPCQLQ